jgi:hypothetical protein
MIINGLVNDTASSSDYAMLNGNVVDWTGKYVGESSHYCIWGTSLPFALRGYCYSQ